MGGICERFEKEIRRGAIQLAVVCLLERELYGYEIVKKLKKSGFRVEEGTIYPLLRRLESEGILESKWNTGGGRPRKYYRITDYGKKVRKKWLEFFRTVNQAIKEIETFMEADQ
ncbi:PadR family transcriptional regulator [Methanothermobacter sp. K4]|uniref:PadR family transcriptional regulator n=1 Tax=Methanothermobacter sp. K4 TaxID=2913262 RepID=UPI001EDB8993|nr:PadR family transcriptional regulator [Methanothermobacter sp. K4]MCG2829189.1 PadR family transcriptional regulator [Methanothermobacter sp. K4]